MVGYTILLAGLYVLFGQGKIVGKTEWLQQVETDREPPEQLEIYDVTDNRKVYPSSKIPNFEMFELTFQVNHDGAINPYLPYIETPPPGGENDLGISVDAFFTPDNWITVYNQPAFYHQEFEDRVKEGREWFYPTGRAAWKVRFTPDRAGQWQVKLTARDAGGVVETNALTFEVVSSNSHGFLRVSRVDPRYFEYDDGTYFPALGFNLNYRNLDWINPQISNEKTFRVMGENGIQLARTWISQWSIFGSAWGKWYSHNRAHNDQEPEMGLAHPGDAKLLNYPDVDPPEAVPGSDVYLWLNFDQTVFSDGNQWNFSPCRVFGWRAAPIPLLRNTDYRIRVRYQEQALEGPGVPGEPYGFAVKTGGWLWNEEDTSKRCYSPGTGTVLAATYQTKETDPWQNYPDPENPSWRILEGTFDSGNRDFLDNLYLTIENVRSTDSDASAGHVFIDSVWIEEDLGDRKFGPNLVYKPITSAHKTINQRDAYALDKVLALAKLNHIHIKAVVLEKNDYIFRILNFDGSKSRIRNTENFWGNGRETGGKTMVRYLQEAWWRYLQARWGYSPNIHSWELVNEGPPGPADNGHWILADEFGKFMHCEVFSVAAGSDCKYDHPNDHMVTTSFWGGVYPYHFWKNTSGDYPDLDYVDIHKYAEEDSSGFIDSALFTQQLSMLRGAEQPGGVGKPVMRGEVAWKFSGEEPFRQNLDGGVWLHNFIWAGINSGGLIEHIFVGGSFTEQIYRQDGSTVVFDHRPEFKNYYLFIKDIPLNNGKYQDVDAQVSNPQLRVLGQKDQTNGRAHLWVQNKNHTWKNVVGKTNIPGISGSIIINGFPTNLIFNVEYWDTAEGELTLTGSITSNSNGEIEIKVENLRTDLALRIGDY